MTAQHHRRFDWIGMPAKLIAALALIAICWKILAMPIIQQQIDKTTEPIIDVLEYQTYLMMQTLTDEQLKKADESYITSQRTKIKRHD